MFTNGSRESFLFAILESFVIHYLARLMENKGREMSLNRRRWSNELLDSLIDFQNRTSSELDDSLNKNTEEVCTVDLLNDRCLDIEKQSSEVSSSRNPIDEYNEASMPTLVLSGSEASDSLSNNILNLSIMENSEKTDSEKTNVFSKCNNKIVENITVSSEGTANYFSCDSSNNQNTVDTQSVRSQSTQYSCEIFHEAITFNHEVVTENKENSNSQSNNKVSSKNEVISDKNRFSLNLMSFDNKHSEMHQRYFSSPVEFPELGKEQLGEIDCPDIWDALQELDQALSPFGEEDTSIDEQQPTTNILSRLSQKFKKTPSRFTEKLISILEDSVISVESPTKHNAHNHSGISLHRMTGEFRKLCKFIEDESMPEWAPSMANMTALCADKTDTPDSERGQKNSAFQTPKNMIRRIQDTPTHKASPLALRALLTPKNKIMSRNQTPIKNFTPSADKSFEYWEKICNMMCDPSSAEKIKRKLSVVQERSKLSMDEMLTICERQMASLDDSMIDVRTSEPCKRTDSEVKLKVLQAPRSKSVCNIYKSSEKNVKSSSKTNEMENIDDDNDKVDEVVVLQVLEKDDSSKEESFKEEKLINLDDTVNKETNFEEKKLINFDETVSKEESLKEEKLINLDDTINDTVIMTDSDSALSDSSFLKRRVLDVNDQDLFKADSNDYDYELLRTQKSDEQKSFENDFQAIAYSPQEIQERTRSSELSYDPDDPDCSLIAELALRRQRCLETAKLMMEIDQEDPMTNAENTCAETLYKLGIQDKTFAEVEEDTKFLTTLNQCLEYRNYFSEKKQPIIKALQKFDTPEEMKKRTRSIIRSQSQMSAKKPPAKPSLQRANSAKTLSARKITTPSLVPSTGIPKVTPKVSRTFSNLRATPRTTTPRVSATTPRVSATTPRISSTLQRTVTTPRVMTTTPRPMPRSISKLTPQVTKRTLYPHTEQSKSTLKLPGKTPQLLQQPLLRRPILRLSPKTTQKLTPPSDLKPCTPRQAKKLTSTLELKSVTPRLTKKLTPPLELKPRTPRTVAKVTSPSRLKISTPRPAPKLTPRTELHPRTPRPTQKLTPPPATKVILSKPAPKRVAALKSPTDEETPSPTATPRPRFFLSPGKSPSVVTVGRKKPATYFSEKAPKTPLSSHKINHDIKSPIGLYINSVDNDLIKNIHAKTNDRLLTPVSYGENGKSPTLKVRLASKENQSPTITCNENIVLSTVRYQSAKNVCLIDKKRNYSPSSITPNSKTKQLLESIENTVVIRHEGRMVEPHQKTTYLDPETSIRVQKVAEKTTLL